jgi:hypothetical protein
MKSETRMQPLIKMHKFQPGNRMIYREKRFVYCNSSPLAAASTRFASVKDFGPAAGVALPEFARIGASIRVGCA